MFGIEPSSIGTRHSFQKQISSDRGHSEVIPREPSVRCRLAVVLLSPDSQTPWKQLNRRRRHGRPWSRSPAPTGPTSTAVEVCPVPARRRMEYGPAGGEGIWAVSCREETGRYESADSWQVFMSEILSITKPTARNTLHGRKVFSPIGLRLRPKP